MKRPELSAFRTGAKWYGPRIVKLFIALFGVLFFMYYSDVMSRALIAAFNPEVDPSFTGGHVARTVYDPVGDDHGFGGLTYPNNGDFTAGALDLVRYVARVPVWGARWQAMREYWQLDLVFASGPARVRAVRIYVDADGDGLGSVELPSGAPEGLSLDPAHPWDWRLAIDGLSGSIESADGTLKLPVEVSPLDGEKGLRVRVPLENRALRGLFGAESTWQYVFVSAWSPWSRGAIMPASRRPSIDRAGGSASPFTPAVFDLLSDEPGAQEAELSSWDENALALATVKPVEIPLAAPAPSGLFAPDSALVAELESLSKAEAERSRTEAANAWTAAREALDPARSRDETALIAYAIAAFNADARIEAERAIDCALDIDPEDPTALGYKGALVARRAGDAPALAAVSIVADAYRYLDRAVELAAGPDEAVTARLCRANVSMAVPEAVFGKRAQGASDFLAAAKEGAKGAVPLSGGFTAECYRSAGQCLEDAGRADEAGTWFREAARLADSGNGEGVSPATRLALARKGYLGLSR